MSSKKLYNLTITVLYVIIFSNGGDNMAIGKDKTGVLVNMDKSLKSILEDLAKKDNRSLTSYIVNILKKHVDNISNE